MLPLAFSPFPLSMIYSLLRALDSSDRPNVQNYHFYAYNLPSLEVPKPANSTTLLEVVSANQLKTFQNLLSSLPSQDISHIRDAKKRTLVHLASVNNNSYVFHQLVSFQKHWAEKAGGQSVSIEIWLSSPDELGNTVAHYAAFNGNLEIMRFLQKQNLDFNVRND